MSAADITASMTVLEVVGKYRATEEVFRRYEDRAGECILRQALFEPLRQMAAQYGLDLDGLRLELRLAARMNGARDVKTTESGRDPRS